MEEEFKQWRSRCGALLQRGRGRRYPVDARRSAATLARRGLASGMTMAVVCRALGIPGNTLREWLGRDAMVPVVVVANELPNVRLVIGRGYVELTKAQLLDILGHP